MKQASGQTIRRLYTKDSENARQKVDTFATSSHFVEPMQPSTAVQIDANKEAMLTSPNKVKNFPCAPWIKKKGTRKVDGHSLFFPSITIWEELTDTRGQTKIFIRTHTHARTHALVRQTTTHSKCTRKSRKHLHLKYDFTAQTSRCTFGTKKN